MKRLFPILILLACVVYVPRGWADNIVVKGSKIQDNTVAKVKLSFTPQDWDADLDTLSALGNNKIPYTDNTGVMTGITGGTAGTALKSLGPGNGFEFGPVGGTPGGSDTHVQFNDGGVLGGDAGLVYNKTTKVLTLTDNVVAGNVVADNVVTNRVQTNGLDNTHLLDVGNTSNPALGDGQCAYDKTKEIWECSDETDDYVLGTKIDPIQWSYASPDNNAVHYIQVIRKSNITNFWCLADPGDTGESITVTVKECTSTGDSCADNGISVAADNDGTDDTSFTDSVIDADDLLEVTYSTTDTITSVNCTLERWRE